MQFSNIAAIVTGGASGLGLATARLLAGRGAMVATLDRAPAGPDAAGLLALACDITDEASVIECLDTAEKAHGPARILVNCAGIAGSMRLVGRNGPVDMAAFARVIDINLNGTVSVMSKVAARMAALEPIGPDGERGVIVNTASITAFEGQIGQGAYVASKGAIAALTLQAAREFAAFGVRVMAIAPGLFDTPMAGDVPESVRQAITSDAIFPARFGRPEDFADLVAAICSNPMLNGEVIRLDAGVRLRAR